MNDDLSPDEIQQMRLRHLIGGSDMIRLTTFSAEVNAVCELCDRQVIVSNYWRETDQAILKVKIGDKESVYRLGLQFEKKVCGDCAYSALFQALKKD